MNLSFGWLDIRSQLTLIKLRPCNYASSMKLSIAPRTNVSAKT
ncbi:hypothetical protein VCR6J2_580130 [Vibrio coralliirubri]|nr:hypothetical protein VCR6J2_580130 [Vibrio coralliirubri]